MPRTKTHFPQIPVEIVKEKIVKEDEVIESEAPEQLRGPMKKTANGKPSAQVKQEGGEGDLS